jgi:hypothetical protein
MVCVHSASTAVRTSKTLFLNDACAIASDTRRSTLRAAPRIMYVHTNGWSKGHGGRVVRTPLLRQVSTCGSSVSIEGHVDVTGLAPSVGSSGLCSV